MKSAAKQTKGLPLTTVALVGFRKEDESSIQGIFDRSECPLAPGTTWRFHSGFTVSSALKDSRQDPIPVVLCNHDFVPAAWKEMLEQFPFLPKAPLLIVTSRLADERLWAEALNLGAYDVLARPFDRAEVIRSVSSACLHWHHEHPASSYAATSAA